MADAALDDIHIPNGSTPASTTNTGAGTVTSPPPPTSLRSPFSVGLNGTPSILSPGGAFSGGGLHASTTSGSGANGAPVKGAQQQQQQQQADVEDDGDESLSERAARLEKELEATREEKETYANQYRTLLSRIQTMKNTLGNKLKQDAEELDRREQTISTLNLQIEDLQSTVSTLQTELVSSNEESERLSKEMEGMRNRTLQLELGNRESMVLERELKEVREEAERLRIEKEDLGRNLQKEKVSTEEAREQAISLRKDLESEKNARIRAEEELAKELERCSNLQSVLEDFQSAKDIELRQAVQETETQLNSVTMMLAEFKSRALKSEAELQNLASSSSSIEKLETEIKEKTALIGKLRHQQVVTNEHLNEALRRLNKSTGESNVDRRLVTNILISFLNTPRGDSKRFEILGLLSSVLSWTEDERERAGLQRSTSPTTTTHPQRLAKRRDSNVSTVSDTGIGEESFSKMWVEFLLKEATQGQGSGANAAALAVANANASGGGSTASSPTSKTFPGGLFSPKQRVSSMGSLSHVASSHSQPNMLSIAASNSSSTGSSPPGSVRGAKEKGKGKGKELPRLL